VKSRLKNNYTFKNIVTEPTGTKFTIIVNLVQSRRNPRNNNYSVARISYKLVKQRRNSFSYVQND